MKRKSEENQNNSNFISNMLQDAEHSELTVKEYISNIAEQLKQVFFKDFFKYIFINE